MYTKNNEDSESKSGKDWNMWIRIKETMNYDTMKVKKKVTKLGHKSLNTKYLSVQLNKMS